MSRFLSYLVFLGPTLALAGCGAAGAPQQLTTVGPNGGVATSLDGALTLELPVGALTEPTTIGIETRESRPDGDRLSGVYALTPEGLTFNVPVTIRLAVENAPPAGQMAVLRNADTGEAVDGSTWDAASGEVSGTLSHLSAYAAYVAGLEWYTTCGDPVCGGFTAPTDVPVCTTELEGAACETQGASCYIPDDACNVRFLCSDHDPKSDGCPI